MDISVKINLAATTLSQNLVLKSKMKLPEGRQDVSTNDIKASLLQYFRRFLYKSKLNIPVKDIIKSKGRNDQFHAINIGFS